jgi:hypothetical protein
MSLYFMHVKLRKFIFSHGCITEVKLYYDKGRV